MPFASNNGKFAKRLLIVSHRDPFAVSLALSLVYIVFCSLYIWYSGRIAAALAPSVTDLEQIELTKGIVFVMITGGLIFVLSFLLLRKVAQMNTRLMAQNDTLIATERIATAGLFATSTCHDINNIMSVVSGNLEMLQRVSPLNADGEKCLSDALDACRRLTHMTKRLLTLGHEKLPGAIDEIDLCRVIREAINFAASHKKLRRCSITSSLPDTLPLHANPLLISRMILNLLVNAADATGENGHIEIRLIDRPDAAILEVHDNGPGVPQNQREIIFEPFHTTKMDGNGLGLLSVKACLSEHRGAAEITDSDLGGACFRIIFPRR